MKKRKYKSLLFGNNIFAYSLLRKKMRILNIDISTMVHTAFSSSAILQSWLEGMLADKFCFVLDCISHEINQMIHCVEILS